jgi:hypothetical protein
MEFTHWIGFFLYLIQTVLSVYLLFWYLPKNITSDKPDNCSSQDKDDSSFFNGWISKCDITIGDDSKKYLSWLFYFIGIIKLLFDLLMLYLITLYGKNTSPTSSTSSTPPANPPI